MKWVKTGGDGGGEGGVSREGNMENSFFGLEAEELILDL